MAKVDMNIKKAMRALQRPKRQSPFVSSIAAYSNSLATTYKKQQKAIAKAQAAQKKAELREAQKKERETAKRIALLNQVHEITSFNREGGKYSSQTSRKINRLVGMMAMHEPIDKLRAELKEVKKEAAKERREVANQHKLLNKRIEEAQQVYAQNGKLSREYDMRLRIIKGMYADNPNQRINEDIMTYLRNQRKGQVLRAEGAYEAGIEIKKAVQASGSVAQVRNGKLYMQAGAPQATAFDMDEPLIVPKKYRESEIHALARFSHEKLMDMKKRMKDGEEVKTGRNLDSLLMQLKTLGVIEYDTVITNNRQNISLEKLKWKLSDINKIYNEAMEDDKTKWKADMIRSTLEALAGYERFSDEAAARIEKQRNINRAIASGGGNLNISALTTLLGQSAIYYKFYPYKKGKTHYESEQEQEDIHDFVSKAETAHPYFPKSLVDFTDAVIAADEGRYHPLLDKWCEAVLYVYSNLADLRTGNITKDDIDSAVENIIS